ncbi:MAG: FprA family A-type flavoprotein, partial [Bacteroidaceae bacterium]|nr:FprA family A-type flavoprotein [Bacteroidaceae bacterium]
MQVQALLKKAAALDIARICPLHGPMLSENLAHYVGLYDKWSSYTPETDGVLVAYASIYGGTTEAATYLANLLQAAGKQVVTIDLWRCDMSHALSEAFRMSHLAVCAASYDAGLFPPMRDFLYHLKIKNYQSRKVGIIENGSWAPTAGRVMRTMLEEMKNIEIAEPMVTIRSRMKKENTVAIEQLANALLS